MSYIVQREGAAFEIALNKVRIDVIDMCKDMTMGYWGDGFHLWLRRDAILGIGAYYTEAFSKEFKTYLNPDVEAKLFYAGSHTAYAIAAYYSYRSACTKEDLLGFLEAFITKQFADIGLGHMN
jgi:hypothetical protein